MIGDCSFFGHQRLPSCPPHHHTLNNSPSTSRYSPQPLKQNSHRRRKLLRRLCISKISTRGSKSQVRLPHDAPLRSPTYQIIPLGITVLKASLRGLFKSYGEVLDVVAHKNLRMRGQAFVSFASTDIAKKAAKEVRGFPLYSKPMVRSSRDFPFLIDKAIHQSKYRLQSLGQTPWCRSWTLRRWILTRQGGYSTRVRLPF